MTGSPNESWPAVFLDRDGTLMRDVDYCGDPGQVDVYPETAEALRRLKEKGYKLVIITNQSGIGRGYFTEEDYRAVETEFRRQLGHGLIDASYHCPDLPTSASIRRKPGPGMVFEAQREHRLDLRRSFFVGDKASDIGCGQNAGVRTILVQTGFGPGENNCRPDWVARDIRQALDIILRSEYEGNLCHPEAGEARRGTPHALNRFREAPSAYVRANGSIRLGDRTCNREVPRRLRGSG